jgi:signal transduction histidine kinase
VIILPETGFAAVKRMGMRLLAYIGPANNSAWFDVQSLSRIGEGFGLGVKSMNERVQSASGTMHIESAPDKGTSVAFYIPLPI